MRAQEKGGGRGERGGREERSVSLPFNLTDLFRLSINKIIMH